MVGLVEGVAATKRANHLGRVTLSSFMSLSGVLIYGSDSKTPQCRAKVELHQPSVQLMRVDFPKTLLYRENN